MLTREAWNAFLKTLEEPPPNTVFVLCTTEAHKVHADDRRPLPALRLPAPVARADRRRSSDASPTPRGSRSSDGAVAAIARAAAGSFRDALGTLDQLVTYGGKQVATDDVLAVLGVADAELILAAADAIAAGDGRAVLEASERLRRSGRDVTQFGRDLLAHLRQLVVVRTLGERARLVRVTVADPERLRDAGRADLRARAVRGQSTRSPQALAAVREGDEPRMTLELALLRAARPQLDPSSEALLQRLERLEATLDGRAGRPAPAASGDPASRQAAPTAESRRGARRR